MSVQSNTYLMVGVKLDFDAFTAEQRDKIEPYEDSAFGGIHHHNGLCAIVDGMNGDYIFIGRVLAKSDDQNGNYGFNQALDTAGLAMPVMDEVIEALDIWFGIQVCDLETWVFTHYR